MKLNMDHLSVRIVQDFRCQQKIIQLFVLNSRSASPLQRSTRPAVPSAMILAFAFGCTKTRAFPPSTQQRSARSRPFVQFLKRMLILLVPRVRSRILFIQHPQEFE